MSLNRVMLIGNVGRDPQIRVLPDSSKMARLSLATQEWIKSRESGEFYREVQWHTIVCWGGLAELADQRVKRGTKLYVEGRIKSSKWIDKATQESREAIEILANKIILLRGEAENETKTPSVEEIIEESLNPKEKSSDNLPF